MEITINDFTSAKDPEKSRYLLMNKLLMCQRELDKTRLYPTYQILINIHSQLTEILDNYYRITQRESSEAEVNESSANSELEKSFELMEWAMKQILNCLENARAIYDFVSDNINIESIGLDSPFNREGYFAIPDNRNMQMKVMKYSNSLYRVLKTKEVDSFKISIITMPSESLRNLIISGDILNQIVYHIDTQLSFPFRETIMPVAKRKFLEYLEKNSSDEPRTFIS
ncbi:MAG: hypothetical protein N2510_05625 [Ignavibacteria bacterium]|nr:hypothetical protein [Ignavibacteria bacterium]